MFGNKQETVTDESVIVYKDEHCAIIEFNQRDSELMYLAFSLLTKEGYKNTSAVPHTPAHKHRIFFQK